MDPSPQSELDYLRRRVAELERAVLASDPARLVDALRASEERFHAVVGQATAGIVQTDSTGRFLLVNDRFCAMVGRTRDELLQLSVRDITHPDDLAPTRDFFARAVDIGAPFAMEKRYLHPDGTEVWSSTSATVVRDGSEKPVSIVAVAVDITERKRAEQELEANRQQVDAVIASSPLPIVALTSEGDITLWNPAAERLFGWTADEVMGRPLPFIPEEKLHEHRAMRKRDLAGEGFTNRPISRRRKDGSIIDLSVSTAPLKNQSGHVVGIMSMYVDVTEQRRMEHSLRESEAKFRALVEQSPLSIQVVSPEGQVLSANPAWERLWGMTADHIADVDAFGHGQLADRGVLPYLLRARAGEAVEIPELPFIPDRGERKDQTIWVRAYAYPVRNAQRAVSEIVIVQEDVTARRRAEQRLRESEARFRMLFDVSRDAIGVASGEEHAYVNQAYAALFGYDDPAQLAAVPVFNLIAPSAREGVREMRRRRVAGEAVPNRYVTKGLRRDGTEFDAEMHVSAFLKDGAFHTLVIIRDVTFERAAQQELTRSEERYRVFVSQTLEGVWRFEHDQPVDTSWPEEQQLQAFFDWAWLAECNDAMARMYGYRSARELTGKRIGDLLDRGDPHIQEILLRFIRSNYRLADFESVERDRDGNQCHFVNSMVGVVADRKLIRTWGTQRDITERKRFEEDLTAANEELRRANAELEEFAYVASHDLREPLRMVNIYTQMLLKRVLTQDPDAQRCAGFVRQGVLRMEELIHDLLSYSRIIHPDTQPGGSADLAEALAHAMETLHTRIDESEATIVSDSLPIVPGDTGQFALVFQNLLSNALKYRKAGVRPCIRIAAEPSGGQWIIAVADNGIGFQQQYAERIFGLFKRLHRDEYPGTGLGLAICQRIVERYGGNIRAEGRPGDGATFFLSLPAG